MKNKIGKCLIILAILTMSIVTYALLTTFITIPAIGGIKTIGIEAYEDSNCTIKILQIDWGLLSPGESKNFTIYLKNEGNIGVILSLTTDNWNPIEASNYIVLTWNYTNGTIISPNEVIALILTLTVDSTITDIASFSFDIIITGEET